MDDEPFEDDDFEAQAIEDAERGIFPLEAAIRMTTKEWEHDDGERAIVYCLKSIHALLDKLVNPGVHHPADDEPF